MPRTAAIQVQKHLEGIRYPVSKEDLVNRAKINKADDNMINWIREMKGEKFKSPAEVSKAME